jgi:hypothetical protein
MPAAANSKGPTENVEEELRQGFYLEQTEESLQNDRPGVGLQMSRAERSASLSASWKRSERADRFGGSVCNNTCNIWASEQANISGTTETEERMLRNM